VAVRLDATRALTESGAVRARLSMPVAWRGTRDGQGILHTPNECTSYGPGRFTPGIGKEPGCTFCRSASSTYASLVLAG
jgi:hypothetical protein